MILRGAAATCLALLTAVSGQSVIGEVSFGQSGDLAPDYQKIPGWTLSLEGHNPHILSDRVALTTIYPQDTKGALWAENNVNAEQWTAELEFRASGGDYASGNMVLWYVQNKEAVEQNTIYTVDKFDGMAIVVGKYGDRGGSGRGYLKDGSQSFQSMSNLDSLAFGHCDYSYHNLGRPSKLRVSNHNGLSVYVDDKLCFSSDQISIPPRYRFGITATATDQPEIIEVFKFTVVAGSILGAGQPQQQPPPQERSDHGTLPHSPEFIPDRPASEIDSNDGKFADLHNRMEALQHQLADISSRFEALSQQFDSKAGQIISSMPNIPQTALNSLNTRVENTERIVMAIQRDVEGRDYKQHFSELNEAMANVRGGLSPEYLGQIVTASAPRMGLFLFAVIAVQVVLAGAYVLYKRRRASAPKKYL